MSLLSTFFESVKSTFEGNDGKISSRKTTAFLFVALAAIQALSMIVMQWLIISRAVVITDANTHAMGLLYDFYVATLAMILLLFGIVSAQNILDLKTFKTAEVKKEEIKQENTEV